MLFSFSAFAAPLDNCKINTQLAFGATTVSTQALAKRSSRKCLTIQNTSPGSTIYIKFDTAHTGTEGLLLGPSTIWTPIPPPVNLIFIKGSNQAVPTTVWEGD